jgi:serine/threonine protein kinase
VVMFEMIQGDHLFHASSGMIMDAVRYLPLDPLPWRGIRVPDPIDAIIRRCLQRDLAERIESAHELENELGRLLLTPDNELEVVCVPTSNTGETTAVISPIGGSLAVNTEDALARSVIEGMKEITRRANENHREVMRSMRRFGLAGLVLLLALLLLLSSQNLQLPWGNQIRSHQPAASPEPAPMNMGNRPERMPDYPR